MPDPIPAEAFPPSDFIREEMEARGWSKRDLARHMEPWITVAHITVLLDGRWSINRDNAAMLAEVFGQNAQTWLNLQAAYDEWLAAQK